MTDREKLIALLRQDPCPSTYLCDGECRYAELPQCFEERFADHLLANGVVVREKDEWEDADDGDGIVCPVCRGDFCVLVHETERFNFCPNCGADMRRRENDGGL